LEGYNWPVVGSLSVSLWNVGSTGIDLAHADFFVNGITVAMNGTCAVTLMPNQSCLATFVLSGFTLVVGAAYPLKIVSAKGGMFSYSIIYGGASTFQPTFTQTQTNTAVIPNTIRPTVPNQTVSFSVPPRYDYYFRLDLGMGETITFSFIVSSWRGTDDVSFTLVNSVRSVLLNVGRVSQYSGNYTPVFAGRYYLRFDNSYSILTTKTISLSYSVAPQTLGLEAYQWNGNNITGSFSNYDTSNIDLRNAQVWLSETEAGKLGGTCDQTLLNASSSCTFSIMVPDGSWVSGTPYVLKLVTASGSFSIPVIAGGNSETTIQPLPDLITFQTVNTETKVTAASVQGENQNVFSRDFFLQNSFAMIGAIAGGVLMISAILGLSAISVATRNRPKGLYGEDENRGRDSRRHVTLFITIGLAALGLVIVSILTPRLAFSFDSALIIPYLLPGVLLLILITSILLLSQLMASILRARRKSLRNVEDKETETILESGPQPVEVPIHPVQVQTKKCRYCGVEIPRDDRICRKCGMPAMHLGSDSHWKGG
jgi:hypothetical protein